VVPLRIGGRQRRHLSPKSSQGTGEPRQVFGAMLRYYRERAGLTRPGVTGAFALAAFADVPSVGYQEGAVGGQPVEEREDVASAVAVRDSRDPGGPALAFAPPGWQAFTARIKGGTLHLG
jgi:Domain of unknown function (DUF397)